MSTRSARPVDRKLRRAQYSTGVLALLYAAFAAASSAPTPLYAIYQERWGFAAVTLTIVFAAYVGALLFSLLCFGSFSDVVGRKPPIVWAICIELLALVVFLNADNVGWLIAARAIQGLATGIAFTTVSAAIVDTNPIRGSLINSLVPLVSLAIGVLSSALAVEVFVGVQSVWIFLIAVFVLLAVLIPGVKETVQKSPGARPDFRPTLRVPKRLRTTLLAVTPVCIASWSLAAFYFSLGPSVVREILSVDSAMLGGSIVAALTIPGAVAVAVSRNLDIRVASIGASCCLIVGLAMTGVALATLSLPGLAVGTAISGAGFGSGFLSGFRKIFVGVKLAERGGMMAAYYAICYAAFSLPALAAGWGVGFVGLVTTAYTYGTALIAVAVVSLFIALRK